MKQHDVLKDMGEIGLSFFFVSSDRKFCKMVNSRGKMMKCQKTWKRVIPTMPDGMNFFTVITRTKPAKSKSKATFETLYLLSAFDDAETAKKANTQFWSVSKFLEDDQKKAWTLHYATYLKDLYLAQAPDDFSLIAYNKLEELLECTNLITQKTQ